MFAIKKRNFLFLLVVAILTGAIIPAAAAAIFRAWTDTGPPVTKQEYDEYVGLKANYAKLKDLENYVNDNYYLPIDAKTLEEGTYKGLFGGVGDPYTVYYTESEFTKMHEEMDGEFYGIGAVLGSDEEGNLVAVEVLSGSAAESAGLQAGDIFLSIDGKSYKGEAVSEAVDHLRGQEGTEVEVRVQRAEEIFERKLIRAGVILPSVVSSMIEGSNLAYIRILSFASHTAEDFRAELTKMEEANPRGLVIDLRNNPGGMVDKGVEIADMLLDGGTVATAKYKDGSEEVYKTSDGRTGLPYVILVNGASASTSEILAGAVQDNKGGVLIGAVTIGKGIIQKLEQFSDGDGARITVAQYVRPGGAVVQGVGVTPDYVVENSIEGGDVQLNKAVELLSQDASNAGGL
ncbi:MAG: S41 family peptidase [Clostridiales Family XIII bacterium]|nr:S41 family peptidase [Clostridiales Family XIII bacterium]